MPAQVGKISLEILLNRNHFPISQHVPQSFPMLIFPKVIIQVDLKVGGRKKNNFSEKSRHLSF